MKALHRSVLSVRNVGISREFDALCNNDPLAHSLMMAARRRKLSWDTTLQWLAVELAKRNADLVADLKRMHEMSTRPMIVCCAGKHGEAP